MYRSFRRIKHIAVAVLLFAFALPLNHVIAASGACSGHGGVNCAAGPDGDGSVICVDGWRNSSVSYSSMVKCAEYSPTPTEKPTEPTPTTTTQTTAASAGTASPSVQTKPSDPIPVTQTAPAPTSTNTPTNNNEDPEYKESSNPVPKTTDQPNPVVAVPEQKKQQREPVEPATPAETVVGLGILSGMGYGGYRGSKFVIKKAWSALRGIIK